MWVISFGFSFRVHDSPVPVRRRRLRICTHRNIIHIVVHNWREIDNSLTLTWRNRKTAVCIGWLLIRSWLNRLSDRSAWLTRYLHTILSSITRIISRELGISSSTPNLVRYVGVPIRAHSWISGRRLGSSGSRSYRCNRFRFRGFSWFFGSFFGSSVFGPC